MELGNLHLVIFCLYSSKFKILIFASHALTTFVIYIVMYKKLRMFHDMIPGFVSNWLFSLCMAIHVLRDNICSKDAQKEKVWAVYIFILSVTKCKQFIIRSYFNLTRTLT